MASIIFDASLRNLMLNEATDGTVGINKIRITYSDNSNSPYEDITWNAASNGSVSQASDVVFGITAGKTVESFTLANGTTAMVFYEFDTAYVYSENGTFTVRNTSLTIPELG